MIVFLNAFAAQMIILQIYSSFQYTNKYCTIPIYTYLYTIPIICSGVKSSDIDPSVSHSAHAHQRYFYLIFHFHDRYTLYIHKTKQVGASSGASTYPISLK